jgi:hypothetical protein
MEPSLIEDFRQRMIKRFANCLLGELERGARMAHYRAPRIVAGVDLVVNYNLGDLSKQVEYTLDTIHTHHHRKPVTHKVTLNTVNGQLRFTACAQYT